MSDRMKTILMIMVASLALGAWAATASAVVPVITFDENGNGTSYDGTSLPWNIGSDGGPGGMANAFYYQNGPHLVGDLLIQEIIGGPLSDVVRFGPDGTIFFYSEVPEQGESQDKADIGLPSAYYTNQYQVTEVGLEGYNWVDYTPSANQPRFVASVPDLTYHIISDVPEPATLSLLALGGLLALRRRR